MSWGKILTKQALRHKAWAIIEPKIEVGEIPFITFMKAFDLGWKAHALKTKRKVRKVKEVGE